ncbi:hypothetical protein R50912_33200 [Paenibacillus sp. FSL R5-0912]|nr:hypothetical protein R50912_33200 [Paenibacillus sp. FSL R5-0912]
MLVLLMQMDVLHLSISKTLLLTATRCQPVIGTDQSLVLALIMLLVSVLDVLLWEQWGGLKVFTTLLVLLLVQFLAQPEISFNVGGRFITLLYPKLKSVQL